MKRFLTTVLIGFVAVFGVAACGDDNDEGDLATYCRLSAELDQQEDLPSDDQLDEIRDAAPSEIRDEVDVVVDSFKEANDDPENFEQVFDDPDFEEAITEIEAFEDENCTDDTDTDTDDTDTDTNDDRDTTTTSEDDDDDTTSTTESDDTTTTSEA